MSRLDLINQFKNIYDAVGADVILVTVKVTLSFSISLVVVLNSNLCGIIGIKSFFILFNRIGVINVL